MPAATSMVDMPIVFLVELTGHDDVIDWP